jgi:hypothetical protein
MHLPAGLHGQPGWVAALTPLPAGGMIVAEPIWARIGQDQALGAQECPHWFPVTGPSWQRLGPRNVFAVIYP